MRSRTLLGHVTECWTSAVAAICLAPQDTRTVGDWTHLIGTSERRFREWCAVLDVSAKDSLDFARVLRLVIRREVDSAAEHLIAEDQRTVDRILVRAGLGNALGEACRPGFHDYLRCQTFVVSTRGRRVLENMTEDRFGNALKNAPKTA